MLRFNAFATVLAVFFISLNPFAASAQLNIGFENLALPADTFFNGSNHPGGFLIENVMFKNKFERFPTFESWSGFAISGKRDTTTPGFTNQYSCIAGKGHENSTVYSTVYTSGNQAVIKFPVRVRGEWLHVNNSTYAYRSMKDGDTFAKKFGGPTGNDPDFFKLSIARWVAGEVLDTIPFYLADFRFAENSQDYIIKNWSRIDLFEREMDSLSFSLSSSDNGDFGMNTPAYFCLDNLLVFGDGLSVKPATISPVSMYPNPASEYLTVSTNQLLQAQVQVINLQGAAVQVPTFETSPGVYKLEIRDLPRGMYRLKVQSPTGISVGSFIKE
jgi:hypothetical protein